MAGETQRMHAVKELDAGSKLQDEGTALEQQSDKATKESSEHFSTAGTEARANSRGAKVEKLEKKRDCPQQREAVIRPQQAGKIDFRSLQNRSKFATDRTWSSGKGSPQSPNGKGRSREKGKRSGKAERGNPQQLYRLSITNPRSNNPIGIAYPQQKVSPPKKLEASRGPLLGSYRFHVPSIPEREAELQQEELNYGRCFQEASSNLTTPSYTSQALVSSSATSSHAHPPLSQQQQQQPASMESSSTQPGSQLMLADFQLSGSGAWPSPERTFNGANKATAFVPGAFQYGYNFLEESTSDSFSCEQNTQSQDFTDSSLGSVHVTHSAFSFAPGDGQNIAQNSTQFSNEQQSEDGSSYSHSPQSQYIQGVASSIQCPRSLSEDSASSDSSGSGSQQTEQGKTSLSESADTNGQADSRDAAITSGNKRSCHPKDTAANQRTFIQGSVHHARTISQGPGSHMHFSSKTFNSPPVNNIHKGSMPFDKNMNNKVLNRLPHSWEGPSKTYSPGDQNTIQYSDMNDKFHFQEQPALDQRPNPSKNSRMPWQQMRPTSAMPNQNRVELSRQISNQKSAYIVSPSDWQDDSKSHKHSSLKNPSSFQNGRTSDGFSNQRQETVKHSSNTVSTFKVEMNHTQVCESKNKAVYFGHNPSLPVATRNYSYPPLQVPPMGLMMVSPYESPLPSPVHNHASSSTCSSLSPASTSPVNISSEDSQMSKSAPPHTFYHQPQAKAQLASDHLSSHGHQFHSDASRNLTYAPDRLKDDMMSYLQNSTHPKTTMDGNKGYMDSFGVEHHQPPPPYSAHQLLPISLATANLDQLDVLLTCKQCDQNFNNLASFLGHKQYCAQHTFAQNDLKDISKMEDSRKFHAEPSKAVSNVSMARCPPELHLSLLGLNKNGELISDGETKGDSKDDPMKLNLFSGPSNIPVTLPELEMEDAKLDSLITEALNGLSYQSDNVEIDSSFIDAFADDDLTTVKATPNKQCLKTKEPLVFESKSKQAAGDGRPSTQGKYFYDSDLESPETGRQYAESKLEKISLDLEQDEKINIKKEEVSPKNSRIASREKTKEQDGKVKEARKLCKSEDENTSAQRFLLSSKMAERCGGKSFQDSSALRGSTPSKVSTSPTSRAAMKESKRKSSGGGTWSKELIHKIVQQKNKLHKLHVKGTGTKNLQFSLVMERLTPTVQNPAFGEYDYVSDSDDECEPVKIASQGRLNQSSRCKYTYTKECKWRARSERDQAAWRHESKECFEVKKSEELSLSPEKHGSHQRLRRRGSRSSTSSELSTSVSFSSDSINSPKSTDRTDSDCEKKTDVKRKESSELKTYERSSPQKQCKDTLALTFTKSARKYNTDKVILSDSKDGPQDPKKYQSSPEVANPVSSSQKAKDTTKNFEKSRNSHAKSREKPSSHRKETGTTVGPDTSSLQRADDMCPKEEPRRSSSTDDKQLQFESHSPAISKETDFNIDTSTEGDGKEGPEDTTPELSDSSTFGKQSVGVCLVKEAITLANDLDTHKPVSLCTSLMDEVCLSPTEGQGPLIQKDSLHLMPYPLDQEQGLMKSPLSFDTSSMFGDLTGFDSGLYSDMPIQKEGFHSMESAADKKEEFVSSFSPFLEQRDWNLIVSPVLPDEISQYKDNSGKSNEKKPDYNHVPLSLPEKIIDYGPNLNSCASEDELEIKRIVNELENQLQTTKLESPPLLDQHVPKQLQMSKFSPLRLGDESESEGTGLDMRCTVQTIHAPVTRMPSEPFTEPGLPWSSPFSFELMGGHHCPHSPNHNALVHFTGKENDAQSMIATASHVESSELHHDPTSEERSAGKGATLETKEDILEQKRYTENLMKSLEVISDSIFKKEPIISEHGELNVTSLTSQQHQEIKCQQADAFEGGDHSEKEAITGKENILSPANINEQRDDIEFILNESQSSLPDSTDPTGDGNQPISSRPSEASENNDGDGETKVTPGEEITEESACRSSAVTHDPRAESCGNSDADENANQLFKNSSDGQERLTAAGDEGAEAAEGIIGQSGSRPSSPAPPDPGPKVGQNMAARQEQSTDNRDEFNSPHAGELEVEPSDDLMEAVETTQKDHLIKLSPSKTCSPAQICGGSPATDLSAGRVTTENICSPTAVENNTESPTHCSPFHVTQSMEAQHNLLTLPQSDDLVDSDPCEVTHFNDPLKPEAGLAFDLAEKQEEILHVQDIKEHLPIDFMASHQNSPYTEEADESHCLFLNTAPSNSPLSSTSVRTPAQKLELEDDSRQSQFKCINESVDEDSGVNVNSPLNKDDEQSVREALHGDEQLGRTAEMQYSLISPPHLDLGITECKISSSETTSPSPLPVAGAAEPPEVEAGDTDPMYDFKLSPLNYTSVSDEPPHLKQYDYIPISPASKPEDEADVKQSPRGDCEPCDLSINPALIFNKTDTKPNTDTTAKVNVSDEPLVLQQHIQFTRLSMALPAENKSPNTSAGNLKKDLEIYPDPVEPIEQSRVCADLLREAESVDLDPHKASAEDGALLGKKDISDGPPTPKPLSVCEKEEKPLPADSSVEQPTTEAGQCSTTHAVQNEIPQKKTQSNAQQGKVLCEICFMCFRTVPGLKRHKAMKHSLRAEKHIGPQKSSNHQGTALIYEASQTTEKGHKDDSQARCPPKVDGLSESSNILISKASETGSVLEERATETSAVAVDEVGHQTPPPPTKPKKNNKARKNKNSEVNTKPDPFSDELLNILKTDILQAITPEFKSGGGHRKPPEDRARISDRTVTGTEETPQPVTSNSGVDNAPGPPAKETSALNETVELNQITHTVEMKCTSTTELADGEVCADDNVESATCADEDITGERDESTKTPSPVEEACEQKASEESLAQEILRKVAVEIKCEKSVGPSDESHPLSRLSSSPRSPPGLSSDLKALLDDDTTFSQLFPRDEEAKRKKSPRVYSKRNKRQKLSPDSSVTPDFPSSETLAQNNKDPCAENQAEQTFTDDQTNHCEYETISIDDAIMLNMCHNSTLKADAKPPSDVNQTDQKDVPEDVVKPGSDLLNPLESTIDKSTIEWSGTSEFPGFDGDSNATSDPGTCKPEVPATPGPLPLPAAAAPPYPVEPRVAENVQPFHSIDIQSINTTFQLPEVQFFDSNNDISVSPAVSAAVVDVENRDDEKSKKVTERRGRKRQDGGVKVKDKQYKCKVCFTWFLTLGELNFHKLSHNPSPPPTCYMCVQRKFSSREQLRDHLREKHAKNKTGIWTCGMCLKEISDVWMYNEHLREHATQFARRGQSQGSILDIPGCFMQETAVKNFITSIMQHRPSRAVRESSKVAKEQEKATAAAADVPAGAVKTSEGAEPKVHKTKSSSSGGGGGGGGGVKPSTLTPLEVLHNTETSKSVEMHPNCKDPSRDCHHCGKQFPKPFKLQRHLVVHNLEKIFLCHKCPVSYQEARALKDHLKRAHEEAHEPDSKHTTLYTCELCADVMHVIKKSFICSTCNYTFSKKEQFDRHMEKHLSGGNKIFKFRGVLRPVRASSASSVDECDSPASKKRRILSDSLQESSSDSGIASLSSVHSNQNAETQSSKPSVFTADDGTQTIASEYRGDANNASVKTEDMVEDYSELLVELEKCIHMGSSESASPKKEEVDPTPSLPPDKEGSGKSPSEPCDVKEENESVCIRAETTSWSASKESSGVGETVKAKGGSGEGDAVEMEVKTDSPPPSEESSVSVGENQIVSKTPAKHELALDAMDQQPTSCHDAEQEGRSQMKDKAAKTNDNARNGSTTRAPESTPVLHSSKVSLNTSVSNEDKESPRPQKKRKDVKSPHSLQRVSSPATQENFGVDSRAKKKFHPGKCANPSLQRKSDGPSDYPVLSSVRDDVVSNKIVSKCKTANLGLQAKRSLLDSCTPKKADTVNPLNGDYKAKKGSLGRPLHPPISKVSSVPMNNSLNKSRPKMGVRSMESHSYRTAESQNHLLSQLFGQKLTSFKIPLRKDTSESIN